jgi:hypothetical protein
VMGLSAPLGIASNVYDCFNAGRTERSNDLCG